MSSEPINKEYQDVLKKNFAEAVQKKIQMVSELVKSESQIMPLIITKNDSMNYRVSQAQDLLSHEQVIMFACMSSAIAKAIAIIEILKQKSQGPIFQFNQTSTYESCRRLPSGIHTKPDGKNLPVRASSRKQSPLEKDRKYQIPVLYCIITSNNNIKSIENWTTQ